MSTQKENTAKYGQESCDAFSPTTPNELFDITLIIGEQKLYTSRLILSCASPVWGKMLTSDFKEKSSSVIPLPGKVYDEVLEMLLSIMTGYRKPVTRKISYTCL